MQKLQVVHATNGVEALEALKQNPDIKLMLVDNQIPVMHGYTLTAQARKTYSNDELIIIGFSGFTDPELWFNF